MKSDFEEIVYLVLSLVFGIFGIILFFKVWGMTNNVKKLTDHFLNPSKSDSRTGEQDIHFEDTTEEGDKKIEVYDPRLDDIKAGDKVVRKRDGKVLTVDSIKDGRFFCDSGAMAGYKYYSKNEVMIQE
ncbi:hypothetical protein HQ36_02000 [Porphyromonas gingivicanis]|uniref:Uncharacterized protein n=1 Tax=Porphyromonas gingivicanis TaxID=266762 RepID=A0A0A2G7S5_9PORP|nr:hypothetical protein [Porphyromonas gingivicanis]KGN98410.1 hypothetical protein HQ36_02000 [Porphyromonas gingivicanis]